MYNSVQVSDIDALLLFTIKRPPCFYITVISSPLFLPSHLPHYLLIDIYGFSA